MATPVGTAPPAAVHIKADRAPAGYARLPPHPPPPPPLDPATGSPRRRKLRKKRRGSPPPPDDTAAPPPALPTPLQPQLNGAPPPHGEPAARALCEAALAADWLCFGALTARLADAAALNTAPAGFDGATPLHAAAAAPTPPPLGVLRDALLVTGADPSRLDGAGLTPAEVAACSAWTHWSAGVGDSGSHAAEAAVAVLAYAQQLVRAAGSADALWAMGQGRVARQRLSGVCDIVAQGRCAEAAAATFGPAPLPACTAAAAVLASTAVQMHHPERAGRPAARGEPRSLTSLKRGSNPPPPLDPAALPRTPPADVAQLLVTVPTPPTCSVEPPKLDNRRGSTGAAGPPRRSSLALPGMECAAASSPQREVARRRSSASMKALRVETSGADDDGGSSTLGRDPAARHSTPPARDLQEPGLRIPTGSGLVGVNWCPPPSPTMSTRSRCYLVSDYPRKGSATEGSTSWPMTGARRSDKHSGASLFTTAAVRAWAVLTAFVLDIVIAAADPFLASDREQCYPFLGHGMTLVAHVFTQNFQEAGLNALTVAFGALAGVFVGHTLHRCLQILPALSAERGRTGLLALGGVLGIAIAGHVRGGAACVGASEHTAQHVTVLLCAAVNLWTLLCAVDAAAAALGSCPRRRRWCTLRSAAALAGAAELGFVAWVAAGGRLNEGLRPAAAAANEGVLSGLAGGALALRMAALSADLRLFHPLQAAAAAWAAGGLGDDEATLVPTGADAALWSWGPAVCVLLPTDIQRLLRHSGTDWSHRTCASLQRQGCGAGTAICPANGTAPADCGPAQYAGVPTWPALVLGMASCALPLAALLAPLWRTVAVETELRRGHDCPQVACLATLRPEPCCGRRIRIRPQMDISDDAVRGFVFRRVAGSQKGRYYTDLRASVAHQAAHAAAARQQARVAGQKELADWVISADRRRDCQMAARAERARALLVLACSAVGQTALACPDFLSSEATRAVGRLRSWWVVMRWVAAQLQGDDTADLLMLLEGASGWEDPKAWVEVQAGLNAILAPPGAEEQAQRAAVAVACSTAALCAYDTLEHLDEVPLEDLLRLAQRRGSGGSLEPNRLRSCSLLSFRQGGSFVQTPQSPGGICEVANQTQQKKRLEPTEVLPRPSQQAILDSTQCCIHELAFHGDTEGIKFAVEHDPDLLNAVGGPGVACVGDNLEWGLVIPPHGRSVAVPEVQRAPGRGSKTKVVYRRLFLAPGASLNTENAGATPLHYAALSGSQEAVLLLTKNLGADPQVRTVFGTGDAGRATAAQIAVSCGHSNIAAWLLRRDEDTLAAAAAAALDRRSELPSFEAALAAAADPPPEGGVLRKQSSVFSPSIFGQFKTSQRGFGGFNTAAFAADCDEGEERAAEQAVIG
eukprot:TRINITY_DN475_c4_g1_i1.p1 TRINITY_DN475_c4_g1~~TRINITY_DN475_c4_g1_i1.p1  ORF type:complete len:1403 (+),score=395.07 TRINITY_DN475_c4_g1_i1:80-4210(+)